jgi:two-component system response regulator HydG
VAKAVHYNSPVKDGPFLTLNCGAIPEDLIESELFGHKKGAFTGAIADKKGYFEAADGGTLFLDEIGELSQGIQAKLLRFLQEGEIFRVGGKDPIKVDIRLISATNRDLEKEVEKGNFREDLFYRINTIAVNTPALRRRKEDIQVLIEHFLSAGKHAYLGRGRMMSAEAMQIMMNYNWPGNIRELSNMAQFFIFANRDGVIKLEHLPAHFGSRSTKTSDKPESGKILDPDIFETPYSEAKAKVDEDFERSYLERNLTKFAWNISLTAEKTGVDRRTIHRLINKFNLTRPE